MYECFLKQQLHFVRLISKHKQSKSQMCYQCKSFSERVDSHYLNFPQLNRQSIKMKKALQKSKVMTEDFVRRYFLWASNANVTSSDNEQSTSTATRPVLLTPSKNRHKKFQKQKERERYRNYTKKMPKSSSGEIRLRGVFQKPTQGSQKQMIYMRNELPLTKTLVDKYNIPDSGNFKFHYESAELLLDDYKSYILNFLKRTEKSASEYILDINEIWSTVDPNMSLHPNLLQNPKIIETRFFYQPE